MSKPFITTEEDLTLWPAYSTSTRLFQKITVSDLKDKDSPLPEQPSLDYSTDMTNLRLHLTDEAFNRINSRYRKHKQRQNKKITTLTIHKNTLARLQHFARAHDIDTDSIDELIEYLIDPEDRLDIRHNPSSDVPESALSQTRQFKITKASLSLRPHTWKLILNQINMAFHAGWLACKYLNGPKRTQKALEEHAEDYMNKLDGRP